MVIICPQKGGAVLSLSSVKTPCFSLRDVDGEPKSLFVKKRFDNCEKLWYHRTNTLDTVLTLHGPCVGGVRSREKESKSAKCGTTSKTCIGQFPHKFRSGGEIPHAVLLPTFELYLSVFGKGQAGIAKISP